MTLTLQAATLFAAGMIPSLHPQETPNMPPTDNERAFQIIIDGLSGLDAKLDTLTGEVSGLKAAQAVSVTAREDMTRRIGNLETSVSRYPGDLQGALRDERNAWQQAMREERAAWQAAITQNSAEKEALTKRISELEKQATEGRGYISGITAMVAIVAGIPGMIAVIVQLWGFAH